MRIDGRAADEMRQVEMIPGFQEFADGSVLISVGRTRVVCSVTLLGCVEPWVGGASRGWITAEYTMLPRATRERTPRDHSARETEIEQLVGRSLRASLDLDRLGERTFIVDCDVLQADGGTRTAAITGGFAALVQALEPLIEKGEVDEKVWRSPVAAVSVALTGGEMLLDPCHEEDVSAEVDCDVVMNARGEMVEVHAPAAVPYTQAQLDRMLDMAAPAIQKLLKMQAGLLRQAGRRPDQVLRAVRS